MPKHAPAARRTSGHSSPPPAAQALGGARGWLAAWWPAALPLAWLWFRVLTSLSGMLSRTNGHFTYTLDDAYIHMAMAKNLALHGVWGVTSHGFAAASSSPLWTLVLAFIYRLTPTGIHVTVPVACNVIFASLILIVVVRQLRRLALPAWSVALLAFLVTVVAEMDLHVFSGMEHLGHTLLALLFTFRLGRALARDESRWREDRWLLAMAPLLAMARLESLFLLAAAAGLLLLRRRWRYALALPLLGALPIILFGLFYKAHGGHWLPDSALMHSLLPRPLLGPELWRHALPQLVDYSPLFLLALSAAVLLAAQALRRRPLWAEPYAALALFVPTVLQQTTFGLTVPQCARYAEYLMVLGTYAVGVTMFEHLAARRATEPGAPALFWTKRVVLLLLLLNLGLAFAGRLQFNYTYSPRASANIYQQQWQMTRFIQRYYAGRPIAINDIGAISYYTNGPIIDLAGLATGEVARIKHRKPHPQYGYVDTLTPAEIDAVTRGKAEIAIIYDHWFQYGVPPHWTLVRQWRIRDNVVCGGDTVSFYATTPEAAAPLRARLRAFNAELPPGVLDIAY